MPGSESGSKPDSPTLGSSTKANPFSSALSHSNNRRKLPPSRLSTPLAQKHVPIQARHTPPVRSPRDRAHRPILAKTASSVPLVPRGEPNQNAWTSPTSPRKFPFEGLGFRDSIATDPFFRQYYGSRMDEVVQDEQMHSKESNKPWWPWINPDTELENMHGRGREDVNVKSVEGVAKQTSKCDSPTTVELRLGIIDAATTCESSSISEALELDGEQPSTRTAEVLVGGRTVILRLIELPLYKSGSRGPRKAVGERDPHNDGFAACDIDGVITIFNADDPAERDAVLAALNALEEAVIPKLVVSVRTNSASTPTDHRKIRKERARLLFNDREIFETNIASADSAKRCILLLIQHIIYERQDIWGRPASRAQFSGPVDQTTRVTKSQPHSRATSEIVPPAMKSSASYGDIFNTMNPISRSKSADFPFLVSSESSIAEEMGGTWFSTPSAADSQSIDTDWSNVATPSGKPASVKSTNRPRAATASSRSSSGSRFPKRPPMPNLDDQRPNQKTLSLQELVEQLVISASREVEDNKFVLMFLIVYRMFAAPVELMDALIAHFDQLINVTPSENRVSPEQGLLNVLCKWIHTFPGDFAQRPTRARVSRFIAKIEDGSRYVAAAEKLRFALGNAAEDDDTYWSRSDQDAEGIQTGRGSVSTESVDIQGPSLTSSFGSMSNSTNDEYDHQLIFRTTSGCTLAAMGPSGAGFNLNKQLQPPPDAIESAQRQAICLNPSPSWQFVKIHWRQFVEQSEDAVARELTRIDWIMFSAIRPRDLIRHVTISNTEHQNYPGVANIDRIIEHFNRLVDWITFLILYRDKPKHRALALEKFMRVARRLRDLNNYNSLGAVVAAIQGCSIHRLATTRELVPPEVEKNFMKLEILMSTQKGHLPYRLAWDNTSGPRIPFFFLHRRDLMVAAIANKSFLAPSAASPESQCDSPPPSSSSKLSQAQGNDSVNTNQTIDRLQSFEEEDEAETTPKMNQAFDRRQHEPPKKINWTKFEIMGETLLGISRAQVHAYPSVALNPPNEEFKGLLLRSRIVRDEDEMYQRSIGLEPGPGSGAGGRMVQAVVGTGVMGGGGENGIMGTGVRRKLTWLAKSRIA